MAKPIKITEQNSECIDSGHEGLVYLLQDIAIKAPWFLGSVEKLQNEYKIQKDIYEAGFPVAAPYKIDNVIVEELENRETRAFFMERIYGNDLENFSEEIKTERMKEAQNIANCIEKDLGIRISSNYGLYSRNVMWDERANCIKLIDFGRWEKIK